MKGSDIKALEYKNVGQHQGFDDETEYPLKGIRADVTISYWRTIDGENQTAIMFPTTLDANDIASLSDGTKAELIALCESKLKSKLG